MAASILFVIAEMAPLIKIGGLADVGGALPRALREMGLDVRVALPYYSSIETEAQKLGDAGTGEIWRTSVHGVPVYLVEHKPSFGRDNVYGYDDDLERFLVFSSELVAGADLLEWHPDVLHVNDWHPGFLTAHLLKGHAWAQSGRVTTIHNLAFTGPYDGGFASHDLAAVGHFSNAMALAIANSDVVTTVSPTYAHEILDGSHDESIGEFLRSMGSSFNGILNGLDGELFDPETDGSLAVNYTVETLDRRAQNKAALQNEVGLPIDQDVPLIGMVSRLFWQKGIDIAAGALDAVMQHRAAQVVILGQGDEENEGHAKELERRHPDQVAVRIGYDEALGQLIYGGCDIFLMPSRYEPCGVGQMIAMRYGAIPVVRRTGGLADSVSQYDASRDIGTGFIFDEATATATRMAVDSALDVYGDRDSWRRLQQRAMRQEFSWASTAAAYRDVYSEAIALSEKRSAEVKR